MGTLRFETKITNLSKYSVYMDIRFFRKHTYITM